MIGHPAIYAAQALASGLAVALACRTRAHLPLAVLIPFGLACDVALEVVGPAPEGWRFAVGVAVGSAYPWAVVGASWVALGRRGIDRRMSLAVLAAGWFLYVDDIITSGIRGAALARTYACAQAGVAVALALTVWAWRKRREARTVTATCAVICAAAEVANVPAYLGLPSWWSARAVYALAYLALIAVQAHALRRPS